MMTRGKRRPSFQFYPGDWLSDPALSLCSFAAQGLWIRMLCLMHHATPYGHLCTPNGLAIDPEKIAGATPEMIAELESWGVFRRGDDGGIFSARMVEDGASYNKFIERQSKAGKASAEARRAATKRQPDPQPNGNRHTNQNQVSFLQSPSSSLRSPDSGLQTTKEEIDFDDFWQLQVRKESKSESRRLWEGEKATTSGRRMTAEDQHTAIDAYPYHATMWQRERRTRDKVPHPRTWLYQRRWEDEVPGMPTEDERAAEQAAAERRTFMKHCEQYVSAALRVAVDAAKPIREEVKRHCDRVQALIATDTPKGTMNAEFYKLHDRFINEVYLLLPKTAVKEIDGMTAQAAKRGTKVLTYRRKLVQELTGLPDPLDFEIAEEDCP